MNKAHLGSCPKKRGIPVCGCMELIHFCGGDSENHQDAMRKQCIQAVKEGGASDGN